MGCLSFASLHSFPAAAATAAAGSGFLSGGGSFVTLQSPDASDFTIVVEKMSRDHSTCVRPSLGAYVTVDETATFQLAGA